jgi:hypothetical protein
MKSSMPIFAIITLFFMIAACSSTSQKIFTDKKLVIANKETVKIKELNLSITNNGCGRQWESGSERPYCDLLIKSKDSTIHFGRDFSPITIGDIQITIDKMNPWGRQEDSVPPGGCRLWVRKILNR